MVSRAENAVYIAGKLYEARRGARGILRENYAAKVAEYMQMILERVTEESDVMKTGMRCVDLLVVGGYEMPAMIMLAAIVELLEPDEQTPEVK